MCLRAVAFVDGKAIFGELHMLAFHEPIASDFGYYRSGSNKRYLLVALDDGTLAILIGKVKGSVQQNEARWYGQPQKCFCCGELCGNLDSNTVNDARPNRHHCPTKCRITR